MTSTVTQATAFALAALLTAATAAGTNALALQAYAKADAVAMMGVPTSAPQFVTVIGHRAA